MNRNSLRLFALTLSFSSGLMCTGAIAAPVQDQTAQQNGGQARRAQDPDAQLKHLTKRLDLTADQQAQIKTILSDRASQWQSIRADTSLQPEDRRNKMQALRTDTNSKIEAVLNDKQKQSYEQMQSEMRGRMQGHHQDAPPPQQ